MLYFHKYRKYGKKGDAKINLIVCGSVYSMMTKLFRDKKEPLYGRQTEFLKIEPFTPSVVKEILAFHNPGYEPEDLLSLYLYTGSIAKYVELLMDAGATTAENNQKQADVPKISKQKHCL